MRNNRRSRQYRKSRTLSELQLVSNILFILIVILFVVFVYSSIKQKKVSTIPENDSSTQIATADENQVSNQNSTTSETTSESKDITINMALTGDIMCHNTVYNDAFDVANNTYDFSHMFEDIKYHIQTADIAIGNLETTFAGNGVGYSGYPTFNTPEQLAYTLKKVGFDVLSTANNHCYDKGYTGLESTINYLDEADISHTGTYKSEEDQNTILIKDVKGIKIAFLSFTYGTNGITVPSDKTYSVNLINNDLILKQLSLAKEQNPDLICVSMHWGIEYQTQPNAEQLSLANFLFENGADIIIGNHPHVLQSMEKREITLPDGTTKDGFVIYSLGNFISGQNKAYTKDSAILNLNITKSVDGKMTINSVTYTPIYTYINQSASSNKFRIIDLANSVASYEAGYTEGMTESLYKTYSDELANVRNLIGDVN